MILYHYINDLNLCSYTKHPPWVLSLGVGPSIIGSFWCCSACLAHRMRAWLYRSDKSFGYALSIDMAPEGMRLWKGRMREGSGAQRLWSVGVLCKGFFFYLLALESTEERKRLTSKRKELCRDWWKDSRTLQIYIPVHSCLYRQVV